MANFAHGVLAITNAMGTTQQTVTLPSGFDLKAVLIFARHAGSLDWYYQSIGAATGTASQGSTGWRVRRQSTGNTSVTMEQRNDRIAAADAAGGYIGAAVTAWGTESFGITTSAGISTTSSLSLAYLAIGGADVDADCRSLQLLAASGDTAVTGLGFQPDAIFLGRIDNSNINSVQNGGRASFGVSAGTTEHAVSVFDENAVATSDSATNYRRDAISRPLSSSTAERHTVTVTHDADGYTLTQSATGNGRAWVLAIAGIDAAILSGAIPAATGTQALTGAGFAPDALVAFGAPLVTSVGIVATSSIMLGMAADNGAGTDQTSISLYSLDADTAPFAVTNAVSTTTVLQKLTDTTVDAAADVDSWDADGVTLDWTNADAVAGLFTVLVLGGAAAAGPGFRSYYLNA